MNSEQKPEQNPQDNALASKWGKRLTRALEEQTKAGTEKRLKKLRKYVRGDVGDDGEGGLIRTNIIHSNFAAILPQIYAKNPEISVTPSEAAGDQEYPWVGGFCKTLQAVLNRKFIKGAHLKKRAKSAIRAAMTTAEGWAKVSWQRDVRRDQIIEQRIADTQDNLQRIRHLISEIESGDSSYDDLEAQKAELEQQLKALEAKVEVTVVEGIVIDRPLTEDVFILDDTQYDFDIYDQADAIAHRVWMTCDRYKEMFGKEPPKTATRYGQDKKDAAKGGQQGEIELVAVFEVWDRLSSTVYTLCAGADEWARDPYQPEITGQRWYPFFALAFNPVDGRKEPISDAELLVELQDEYSTTRTNYSEHRKENVPVRVYRKGGALTDADVKALANRQSNDWTGIEGDPTRPLLDDIAVLPNPPVDPSVYDVSQILRDAELVLGAGDASKGTINKAKTATEAEIMALGLQSRNGERQDVIEDWIAEMARYAAELMLQALSREQVVKIAGKDAVWPELTKDQVFDLVQIDIRAGSTGKPNQARDREQWAQMLPQIKEAIGQISELRQQGQHDMADTVIKLLEETLRRFDERIDIDAFIPKKPESEEEAPQIPPEMQQQVEQMQAMLEQLQAQNADLQKAADDTAQKMAMERERFEHEKDIAERRLAMEFDKAQMQEETKVEIARAKEDAQARKEIVTEQARAQHEQYLMNPQLADAERQEAVSAQQMQREATQQMVTAIASIGELVARQQDVIAALSERIAAIGDVVQQSNAGTLSAVEQMGQAIASRLSAPKRVVRDEQGNLVGVETVQ